MQVGISDTQGTRPYMEDVCSVDEEFLENASVYSVFDGHGGDEAPLYAAKNLSSSLSKIFKNQNLKDASVIKNGFTNSYKEIDEQINNEESMKRSGATAVSCMLVENDLHVINVGDARAIACLKQNKVQRLSVDHKVICNEEYRRIIDDNNSYILDERLNGFIEVSRSIGDSIVKDICIPTPYCMKFDLNKNVEYIILGCDGVFDEITDQMISNILSSHQGKDPNYLAVLLRDIAFHYGSNDNISVIVLKNKLAF